MAALMSELMRMRFLGPPVGVVLFLYVGLLWFHGIGALERFWPRQIKRVPFPAMILAFFLTFLVALFGLDWMFPGFFDWVTGG